jgi:hypothetical protein
MDLESLRELLEYFQLTLRLVERAPSRAEDTGEVAELKATLQGRIQFLERQIASQNPGQTQPSFSVSRSSE